MGMLSETVFVGRSFVGLVLCQSATVIVFLHGQALKVFETLRKLLTARKID